MKEKTRTITIRICDYIDNESSNLYVHEISNEAGGRTAQYEIHGLAFAISLRVQR